MIEIPLKNPKPDFDLMASVLKGEKKIDKVFSAEVLIDEEIKKQSSKNILARKISLPRPHKDLVQTKKTQGSGIQKFIRRLIKIIIKA